MDDELIEKKKKKKALMVREVSAVPCPSAMMMRMWYALSRFTMLMASLPSAQRSCEPLSTRSQLKTSQCRVGARHLMRGAKEVGPANWMRGVISS